jgi:hypothetical protein
MLNELTSNVKLLAMRWFDSAKAKSGLGKDAAPGKRRESPAYRRSELATIVRLYDQIKKRARIIKIISVDDELRNKAHL